MKNRWIRILGKKFILKIKHHKLALSFAIGVLFILIFAMLLSALTSIKFLNNFGKSAISMSENAIITQTKHLLDYSTKAQAEKYSAILQEPANLVAMIAKNAGVLLSQIEFYGKFNANINESFTLP